MTPTITDTRTREEKERMARVDREMAILFLAEAAKLRDQKRAER